MESTMKIEKPRMRTAEGVFAELKKYDPETAITMHYIRKLIFTHKLPVVCAGRKKLVNLDSVLEYLTAGTPMPEPEKVETGNYIRKVRV